MDVKKLFILLFLPIGSLDLPEFLLGSLVAGSWGSSFLNHTGYICIYTYLSFSFRCRLFISKNNSCYMCDSTKKRLLQHVNLSLSRSLSIFISLSLTHSFHFYPSVSYSFHLYLSASLLEFSINLQKVFARA